MCVLACVLRHRQENHVTVPQDSVRRCFVQGLGGGEAGPGLRDALEALQGASKARAQNPTVRQ